MDIRSTRRVARLGTAALAAAALVLVAGCATGPQLVQTDVTSFNEWSALPAEKTYVFARTLEYQNSLEVQSYEALVRDELATHGFRFVTDPALASLTVTLRPSVMGTRVRVRDSWAGDPFFSPYGFYGARGFYGRGFGWYDPSWAFYSDFNSYDVEVFRRRLELDIDARTTAGRRYYEGKVESTGSNRSLPAAMPYLVRAMFTDFPGHNGETRRVDVEVPRPAK